MLNPQLPLLPVILPVGSGSRLWPASHSHSQKQFLPLVSGSSMIQDTVRRLEGGRSGTVAVDLQ